ncbi:hypothetical protein K457DRAFT_639663 [Linnemannia elongata AG-77]|uniref:Uncharacterized protein n=1 Tax=Linnemannia elongata AG-77 TaxID=1314771 RepID=A0A197JRX3_9FUNG|nr:hypothetical protein K457DRAFT_639663 [Linnemannia elongata AG-77]
MCTVHTIITIPSSCHVEWRYSSPLLLLPTFTEFSAHTFFLLTVLPACLTVALSNPNPRICIKGGGERMKRNKQR